MEGGVWEGGRVGVGCHVMGWEDRAGGQKLVWWQGIIREGRRSLNRIMGCSKRAV